MYYLKEMCCLCLRQTYEHLSDLNSTDEEGLTNFHKISATLTGLANKMDSSGLQLCERCCDITNMIYQFNDICLKNIDIFHSYKAVLKEKMDNKQSDIIVKLKRIENSNSSNETILINDRKKILPDSVSDGIEITGTIVTNSQSDVSGSDVTEDVATVSDIFDPKFMNMSEIQIEIGKDRPIGIRKKCHAELYEEFLGFNKQDTNLGDVEINLLLNSQSEYYCRYEVGQIERGTDRSLDMRKECYEEFNEEFLGFDKQEINLEVGRYFKKRLEEICTGQPKSSTTKVKESHIKIYTSHMNKGHDSAVIRQNEDVKQIVKKNSKNQNPKGRRVWTCNVCEKKFKSSCNYYAHIKIHLNIRAYKCNICKKAFTQYAGLYNHKVIHKNEKPHVCRICQKAFKLKGCLTRHQFSHTGERPYSCDLCNKQFRYKYSLTNHRQGHTGDKPYPCDLCNVAFSYKYNLTKHLIVHTGEKPFTCEVCNKSYAHVSNLNHHKQMKH